MSEIAPGFGGQRTPEEMRELYGEDWDVPDDETNDGYDLFDPEQTCHCGREASDHCSACGASLCHMHNETGCGYCPTCP